MAQLSGHCQFDPGIAGLAPEFFKRPPIGPPRILAEGSDILKRRYIAAEK